MKSYTINSEVDEFPVMSWFAHVASGCDACEVVKEEPMHRQVWGILSDGREHELRVPEMKGLRIVVSSRVVPADQGVVGATKIPSQLKFLTLRSPSKEFDTKAMERLMRIADSAYDTEFRSKDGIDVHYTRKMEEFVMWKFFGTLPKRPLSSVVLSNDMQHDIMKDIRAFFEQEALYSTFGRPYKRVVLLHGPPGTGKTSIVSAVASELARPLAIFNVDSLRDDTFIELLSDIPQGAILLFEDVDSMFRSDRKSSGDGGMTFSAMLNALDGVLCPRGFVIFMTTNHLDRLDDALRRPGRIDRLIRVSYANADQALRMWRLAYPDTGPKPKASSSKKKNVESSFSSSYSSSFLPVKLLQRVEKAGGISPALLSDNLFRHRTLDPAQAEDAIIREVFGTTEKKGK